MSTQSDDEDEVKTHNTTEHGESSMGNREVENLKMTIKSQALGMDLGKHLRSIGKKSKDYTYTATVTSSGDTDIDSSIAPILNVKNGKNSNSEQTVYTETGATMLTITSETFNSSKGGNQTSIDRGDNPPLSDIGFKPPYVVSPEDNISKPGIALLITCQKFEEGLGGYRNGAAKDLNHMYEIFYSLNFEIRWEPFVNRTTDDLKKELIKCAEDPVLEQKQCLVIVVSSHGGEVKLGRPYRPENIPHDINVYGHAITTYNGMIPTTEILDIFDEGSCPYMAEKPKLLFIQACRARNSAKKVDKGFDTQVTEKSDPIQVANFFQASKMDVSHKMETSEDTEEPIQDIMSIKDMLLTPCYEDFLVVFASTAEYVAWSEDDGGVLLKAMYDVFKKKIDRKEDIDLLPTMTQVCHKMSGYQSNMSDVRYDKSKSVMCLLHMLGEEVIFKPKYL